MPEIVSNVVQRAEYGTGEPGSQDAFEGVQFTLRVSAIQRKEYSFCAAFFLVFGSGSSSADPVSVSSPEGGSFSTGTGGVFVVDEGAVALGAEDLVGLVGFGDFVDLGGEGIVSGATSSSSESSVTILLFFFAGSDGLPFVSIIVKLSWNGNTLRFRIFSCFRLKRYITVLIVLGIRYN